MDAGTGFEPVMLRAYETAVVTALPAINWSEWGNSHTRDLDPKSSA